MHIQTKIETEIFFILRKITLQRKLYMYINKAQFRSHESIEDAKNLDIINFLHPKLSEDLMTGFHLQQMDFFKVLKRMVRVVNTSFNHGSLSSFGYPYTCNRSTCNYKLC
jgi:hypothetical protein